MEACLFRQASQIVVVVLLFTFDPITPISHFLDSTPPFPLPVVPCLIGIHQVSTWSNINIKYRSLALPNLSPSRNHTHVILEPTPLDTPPPDSSARLSLNTAVPRKLSYAKQGKLNGGPAWHLLFHSLRKHGNWVLTTLWIAVANWQALYFTVSGLCAT